MIRKYISGIIFTFLLIISVTAHADLELLGQGSSTHGTYNLIYDTDLDITWYDYSRYGSWQSQVDWASGLSVTTTAYTYDDWRLPTTLDGPYEWGYDGTTTAGYNITSSEMGHLFYTELENLGWKDTSGTPRDGWDHGLTNTGYFQNLYESGYWSDTEYATNTNNAWYFYTDYGYQDIIWKGDGYYSMAVHPGRIQGATSVPNTIVPEPASSILFLTGGTLLAGRRYIKRKNRACHLMEGMRNSGDPFEHYQASNIFRL